MSAATAQLQPRSAFCERTQLSYLEAGAGDTTVLLLHGLGSVKEIWWATIIALAGSARVIAPDLPGHGGSPLGATNQLASFPDRINDFISERGLTSVALVGHSLGGHVAVDLALRWPHVVQRLALVGPAIETTHLANTVLAPLNNAQGWATFRGALTVVGWFAPAIRRLPPTRRGGLILPALRRLAYWSDIDPALFHRLLVDLTESQLRLRLGAIRAPALVISGGLDPLIPPNSARAVAAAIPNAGYCEIHVAAHAPMDERTRTFERILLRFLTDETQQREEDDNAARRQTNT